MTAADTAAAAVSQELSPFGWAPGASRPGTKYHMQGIPHFDLHRGESLDQNSCPDKPSEKLPNTPADVWVQRHLHQIENSMNTCDVALSCLNLVRTSRVHEGRLHIANDEPLQCVQ